MIDLSNSWMNNPTFLAQAAHFFGAIAIVMTCVYFRNKKAAWIAASTIVAGAAVKEFWYDLAYELPKQTIGNSTLDFSFYLLGSIVALLLVSAKRN